MDLERALLLGSLFGIDAETLHWSSLSWWLVDVNESLAFRIDYHSKISGSTLTLTFTTGIRATPSPSHSSSMNAQVSKNSLSDLLQQQNPINPNSNQLHRRRHRHWPRRPHPLSQIYLFPVVSLAIMSLGAVVTTVNTLNTAGERQ
ncbi:hypothetical protein DY000_02057813 [Brassica cretica]|uniref:Transmembrane protein n=1 Tax=Brassica cretica TaxID=69181 RepID=A0ABQ7A4S5_BRACR|nr:hypothetical protein DY000_02057813 [Brassica cretica]